MLVSGTCLAWACFRELLWETHLKTALNRDCKKNQVALFLTKGIQVEDFNEGRLLPKWPKNWKFNIKFRSQLKITEVKFF